MPAMLITCLVGIPSGYPPSEMATSTQADHAFLSRISMLGFFSIDIRTAHPVLITRATMY